MLLRPVAAWLACALAGCYAAPEADEAHSALAKVQRVFASDLSTTGWRTRAAGFEQALAAAPAEAARVQRIPEHALALSAGAVEPLAALPDRLATNTGKELGRVGDLQLPDPLWTSADHEVGRFTTGLAGVPVLLGLDRRPLGEPSDREHRTDPRDDRPEATLWQRLRRRLGL